MKVLRVLCLLFSITIVFAKDNVLEFTDEDFSSRVKEHETVLVMFYAPWCGHCKKLKPEYEKAATDVQGEDPPIAFAKVDCTEGGKETCSEFGVSGYPTLKIFRNGEFSKDYNGPREASGIIKYMKAQVGPSSKDLVSLANFEAFTSKDEVVIVGLFEKETDLKAEFLKVADKLREKSQFGHSSASDVLKNQDKKNNIVLYRPKHLHNKFEPNFVVYDGPEEKEAIEKWISTNYHGLVGHRKRENTEDFKSPLIIAYFGVDYVKNPKGTNYWRNRILKVAKNFASTFNFAVSAKDDFQHELNEFGYDYVPSDKPLIFARSGGKKYNLKEEFSVDTFEEFLKQLDAGQLEPYLKSEQIPTDNSGPVTIAVGKNFDEVVINNNKDTLIEFYAPWCGHCKKLTPIYEELGEKMKNEDVAIVKMDATSNDVPDQFEVRGYPTLYWAPKDSKTSPVRYEGGRDVGDFIKYIAKHATNELKGYDRKGNAKKEEL